MLLLSAGSQVFTSDQTMPTLRNSVGVGEMFLQLTPIRVV